MGFLSLRRLRNDPLLQDDDFRRFWVSCTLNQFGGQITALALPLCAVLLLHATPAQMGMLAALQSLPFAIFGLPAGVLLDRCRRLPILRLSQFVQGMVLASVPLAYWLGWLSMGWIYFVGFVIGTGIVVGGSAEQVYTTFLVGRERLIDAQTRLTAVESAAKLVGPGLAGVLVQLLTAPFAIAAEAATFLFSVLNLGRIRAVEPQPAPPKAHPLREMVDGLKFVWRHPLLRQLAWAAGVWHLLYYGYTALQVLYATRVLGMPPGVLGVAQMLGGVGILVATMSMKRMTARLGTGNVIVLGAALTAVTFALLPLLPRDWLGMPLLTAVSYGLLVFLFDVGAMYFFIPYITLRQRVTPDEFLGRMVSTMRFLTVATAPLGALAAGAVAEAYSVRISLGGIGIGAIALTVWMVAYTTLRQARD
ncbi:MFS transporter [Massilia sp. KIM]|uniref:MFS transporter n=1 Tax=Massilia sp. KIM TaxID=1955422 RepID=UPI0009900AFD|nr:MFS transporter [Massilia sp. KIM]OON59641.1 MFS transporter [Massilia sp. KIM]